MSACSVSQWGTQPIKPEFVDSGMTAYLWMLQENNGESEFRLLYVGNHYISRCLKTTATKSDSDLNCLFSSCLAFHLSKQTHNCHLHRLLPSNIQTFSRLMRFPLTDCFQKVCYVTHDDLLFAHDIWYVHAWKTQYRIAVSDYSTSYLVTITKKSVTTPPCSQACKAEFKLSWNTGCLTDY